MDNNTPTQYDLILMIVQEYRQQGSIAKELELMLSEHYKHNNQFIPTKNTKQTVFKAMVKGANAQRKNNN